MWNLNRLAAAMILTCVFTVPFCSAGAVGYETKAERLGQIAGCHDSSDSRLRSL